MKLTIATCQFPTSADLFRNYEYVTKLMRKAAEQGADVVHFPEACLSGYAGSDLESYEDFDWKLLHACTREIIHLAGELDLWTILGSIHPLAPPHKPHNSLYIINNQSQIIDRYDKRFCSGDPSEKTGDLAHYTPGNHFSVFDIRGIRCGTLICYDYRFPELAREYKRRGVQLMFHSFHTGHFNPDQMKRIESQIGAESRAFNRADTLTYPGITMPASMVATAASSYLWISCPNSSAIESCWGSFFVRADGIITGQLDRHETGILISQVDTEADLYDSTVDWRGNALSGILHSGTLVEDQRSENRTEL